MKLFNTMLVMLCLLTLCLWGFQPRYRTAWMWIDCRIGVITGPFYGPWCYNLDDCRFHSCAFAHAYYMEWFEKRTLFGTRPVEMSKALLDSKAQTWQAEKAAETTDTQEDTSGV